ncbi:MAG: hypothetical protein ACQETB_01650 [Halobacteriota archaeon]
MADESPRDVTIEKTFRGISQRLAVHYLRNLGGRPVVDGEAIDPDAETDSRGIDEVLGDGWTADLSARKVNPAGSIVLTEVSTAFTGEPEAVETIVEAFSKKAMRAGG